MEIHNIEAERLKKTFNRICGNTTPSTNTGEKDQFKTEKEDPNKSAYLISNSDPKIGSTRRTLSEY